MTFIIKLLATGFGVGYLPLAPGTWGTALAGVIYWFLFPANTLFTCLITAVTVILSIAVSTKAEAIFNNKDDKRIVIDEIAGFWITMLFLPKNPGILFAGFVFFRFFDVYKPLFINKVQSWKNGLGITADDVFAGIFANIVLQVLYQVNKFIG